MASAAAAWPPHPLAASVPDLTQGGTHSSLVSVANPSQGVPPVIPKRWHSLSLVVDWNRAQQQQQLPATQVYLDGVKAAAGSVLVHRPTAKAAAAAGTNGAPPPPPQKEQAEAPPSLEKQHRPVLFGGGEVGKEEEEGARGSGGGGGGVRRVRFTHRVLSPAEVAEVHRKEFWAQNPLSEASAVVGAAAAGVKLTSGEGPPKSGSARDEDTEEEEKG